jgi:hypothetical protein
LTDLISFSAHTFLIVEERLREQERKGVRMPEGMPLDEPAAAFEEHRSTTSPLNSKSLVRAVRRVARLQPGVGEDSMVI